jgi:hypothetical protein
MRSDFRQEATERLLCFPPMATETRPSLGQALFCHQAARKEVVNVEFDQWQAAPSIGPHR